MPGTDMDAILRNALDRLAEIRKTLAANGHSAALAEFDSLLCVAVEVARRELRVIDLKR
jgi:hypothetical protein